MLFDEMSLIELFDIDIGFKVVGDSPAYVQKCFIF